MNAEQLYKQLKAGEINKSQLTYNELGEVYKYMVDTKRVSPSEFKPDVVKRLGLSPEQYKKPIEPPRIETTPRTMVEENEPSIFNRFKDGLSNLKITPSSPISIYPTRDMKYQQPIQLPIQPTSTNPQDELVDVLTNLSMGNNNIPVRTLPKIQMEQQPRPQQILGNNNIPVYDIPKIEMEQQQQPRPQIMGNNNIPINMPMPKVPTGQEIKQGIGNFKTNFGMGEMGETLSQLQYKARMTQSPEDMQAVLDYEEKIRQYSQDNPNIGEGNWLTNEYATYLPQQFNQFKAGMEYAIPGAGMGAGAAFLMGQAGPQVAIPEEVITMPAAAIKMGKAGYTAGVTKYMYEITAGAMYGDLLKLGVDNKTALDISNNVAIASSAVEGAETLLSLSTMGLNKLAGNVAKKGTKEVAENTLKKQVSNAIVEQFSKHGMQIVPETIEKLSNSLVAKMTGAYALNIASESAEEFTQEGIAIGGEKEAMNRSGLERTATKDEDWQRMKEAGKTGGIIAAVSGGLNAGVNLTSNIVDDKRQKKYSEGIKNTKETLAQNIEMLENYAKSNPPTESINYFEDITSMKRGLFEMKRKYPDMETDIDNFTDRLDKVIEYLDSYEPINEVQDNETVDSEQIVNEDTNVAQNSNKGLQEETQDINIGYHAGDLGKAEFLGNQAGSNRGTGHFGTGTYFVGNKKNIELDSYKDRPLHEVDFNGYNLYKPKSEGQARKLHDLLKFVNTYYETSKKNLLNEKYDDLREEMGYENAEDVVRDLGNGSVGEVINQLRILGFDEEEFKDREDMSVDEFVSEYGDDWVEKPRLGYYINDMKSRYDAIIRALDRKSNFDDYAEELFGISLEESTKFADSVYDEINKQANGRPLWSVPELDKSDSASTRFMKALGFEGVDVRHIPTYDNTEFGSVIYDLKTEQQEQPQADTQEQQNSPLGGSGSVSWIKKQKEKRIAEQNPVTKTLDELTLEENEALRTLFREKIFGRAKKHHDIGYVAFDYFRRSEPNLSKEDFIKLYDEELSRFMPENNTQEEQQDTKDTEDTKDTVDTKDTEDTRDTEEQKPDDNKPKVVNEYKLPSLIFPPKYAKEDEISNRQVHKEIKRELNNYSKHLAKTLGYEHDTDNKRKPEYSNVGHMNASIILWKPNTDYGIYLSFNYEEVQQGKEYNYNSAVRMERRVLYRVTKKNNKFTGLENNYLRSENSENLTVSEIAPVIEKLVDGQIKFDERKTNSKEIDEKFYQILISDKNLKDIAKSGNKRKFDDALRDFVINYADKYPGNSSVYTTLIKYIAPDSKTKLFNTFLSSTKIEEVYDEFFDLMRNDKTIYHAVKNNDKQNAMIEIDNRIKENAKTLINKYKDSGNAEILDYLTTKAALKNVSDIFRNKIYNEILKKVEAEKPTKNEPTEPKSNEELYPVGSILQNQRGSQYEVVLWNGTLVKLKSIKTESEIIVPEQRIKNAWTVVNNDVVNNIEQTETDKFQKAKDNLKGLDALADEARKHIESSKNRLNAGIPLDIMFDYAVIGSSHIAHGIVDFAEFSDKMLGEFGEKIRDYLDEIYEQSSSLLEMSVEQIAQARDMTRKKVKEEKPTTEKEKVTETKGNIQPMVDFLTKKIDNKEKLVSSELYQLANGYYGGLQTSGAYKTKDAYELLEVALNNYIVDNFKLNSSTSKEKVLAMLEKINEILTLIPTQINRDTEQVEKQQFSTPPNISLVAGWVAKIGEYDSVLEPSAGNGGLSIWGLTANAEVTVNEIDKTRRNHLEMFDYDHVFKENAEFINLTLPKDIKPTVVIMNPPFSTAFDNSKTKDNDNIKKHIEQALERLQDGGRAVIITGRTLADGKPKFADWWKKIKSKYNLQANVTINGKNYKKYGTTFDVQLIVIDKTGMTNNGYVTGEFDNVEKVIEALEDVRNERQRPNRNNQDIPGNEQTTDKPGSNNNDEKVPQGGLGSGTGNDSGSTGNTRGPRNNGNTKPGGSRTGTSKTDVQQEGDNGLSETNSGSQNGNRGPVNDTRGDTSDNNTSGTESVSSGNNQVGDNVIVEPTETIKVEQKEVEASDQSTLDENRVFEPYKPAKLDIKDAQEHPAELVESAAMKAVTPPDVKYQPQLPLDIIKKGLLSLPQLEAIVYAGQSHSQILPNGSTRGFFIGDGTGVGKGREIAGIIYDNFLQGRKKAVWITENQKLIKDAKRDLNEIGWKGFKLINSPKKGKPFVDNEGVLVTTYGTLRSKFKTEVSKSGAEYQFTDDNRIKQLYNWLGPDFDGVIAFDEAHNMKSALAIKSDGGFGKTKVSDTAAMGHILHNLFPKAKIVYVSATGAVNVEDLAYAERLGLWGTGTPFPSSQSFVSDIGRGGLAAMELVCRDMKSMGLYIARSISFKGVEYDRVEHTLTKEQRIMYDRIAEAWQIILDNFEKAVDYTQMDSKHRGAALRTFWGNNQRFFNQVITSMQIPSVIEDVKKQLADNKSVVLQLVSTGQAAQERKMDEAVNDDIDLEELDFTPREMLINYLIKYFPVQQFDWTVDDNGKPIAVPVVDSEGNPVLNPEAIKLRDKMIADFNDMPIPEDVLTILFDEFGSENIAEITGRSRRVVYKENEKTGIKERIIQKISANAGVAEEENFMSGKKRILVFSNAGGTGRSYHASRTVKNQQQRVHYLIEAGYSAMKAIQGFGRTHRSNESSAPLYRLVSTDLSGQKRFISTIARRLGQLGAMTKGQRQASSGIFTEKDNLEGPLASSALANFYRDLVSGSIEELDSKEVLKKMGLEDIVDQNGDLSENNPKIRKIPNFLNRILSLTVDMQNQVFAEFENRLNTAMDYAIQTGTLDVGLEILKGESIEVTDRQLIKENKELNTKTELVKLKVGEKVKKTRFEELPTERLKGYYKNEKSGSVRAVYTLGMTTKQNGSVVERIRFVGQAIHQNKIDDIDALTGGNANWVEITENEAVMLWEEAYKEVSDIRYDNEYMVTGTLLPMWDRLPTDRTRVMRTITNEGEQLLGRILSNSQLQMFMQKAGINIQKDKYTSKIVYDEVYRHNKVAHLENGWKIERSKVNKENRLELTSGKFYFYADQFREAGLFNEIINYNTRWFIPVNENTEKILDEFLKYHEIVGITEAGDSSLSYKGQSNKNNSSNYSNGNAENTGNNNNNNPVPDMSRPLLDVDKIKKKASKLFNVTISDKTERFRKHNALGYYKPFPEVIRTKYHSQLGVIMHEIGHHLDKKYEFSNINPAIIQAMINKMDDAFRSAYKDYQLPGESIAEFIRYYMTDTKTAKDFGGTFYQLFEDTLDKKDLANIKDLRADVLRWMQAEWIDKAKTTMVSANDTEKKSLKERFAAEETNMMMFDDLIPLENFDKTVEVLSGKKLRPEEKSYFAALMTRRNGSIIDGILRGKTLDTKYKIINDKDSLEKIVDDAGKNVEMFELYLKIKHALTLEDKGHQVMPDDIEVTQERLEAIEQKHPEFVELSERLYKWYDTFFKAWVVDTKMMGPNSKKIYQVMKTKYPYYVPMFRSKKSLVGDDVSLKKSKDRFVDQKNVVDRLTEKGSDKPTIYPIESIISQVNRIINAYTKNNVMRIIVKNYTSDEGLGIFIDKVAPDIEKQMVSTDKLKERLEEKLDDEYDLKLTGKDIDDIMDSIDDILVGYRPLQTSKDNDIVTVIAENGKRQFYEVFNANLLKTLTNMDKKQLDFLTLQIAAVRRTMTSLTTGSNPFFAIFSNAPRDIQQAYVYGSYINPFEYGFEVAKAIFESIIKTDDYKDFVAMGSGYAASMYGSDRKAADKLSKKLYRRRKGAKLTAKEKLDYVVEGIEVLNDAVEIAPRLAEFRKAYKIAKAKGMDDYNAKLYALYKANDVTLNFLKKGTIMNTAPAQGIPFLNAGLQGIDKLKRSIKDKETRNQVILKSIISLTIPTILLWLRFRDDEDYQKLSKGIKDNYWIVYKNEDGTFVRIPKPRDLSVVFSASFERGLETYFNKQGTDAFDGFLYTVSNSLLPPLDTIARPIIDVGKNQKWSGGPIVSQNMFDLLQKDQYDDTTSRIAVHFSRAVSVAFPDSILASPKNMDYLLDQYFGGIADIMLPMTTPSGYTSAEFIRRKFNADPVFSNDSIDKFYSLRTKTIDANNSLDEKGTFSKDVDYVAQEELSLYYSAISAYWKDIDYISNFKETTQLTGEEVEVFSRLIEYSKYGKDIKNKVYNDLADKKLNKESIKLLQRVIRNEIVYLSDKAIKEYNQYHEKSNSYVKDLIKE